MKRKICSVLFAAVLVLFFAPLSTFAFASGGGGGGIRPAELPDRLESLGDLTFDSWEEADDYYQSLGAAVARYLHITDLGNIPTYWACKVATTGLKVLYPPACSYAYALDEETKELIKFMIDDGSTTVIGNEPPTISINAFSEVLENQNNTISPKNRTMHKYSWRELSNSQPNYSGDYLARAVGKDGKFIDDTSFYDGIYVQPYVIFGDVKDTDGLSYRGDYYSPYQYHIYLERDDSDNDEYDYKYTWYSEALFYQIEDGERLDVYKSVIDFSYFDYQYITVGIYPNDRYLYFYTYKSLLDTRNRPDSYYIKNYAPGAVDSSYFIKSVFRKFYKSNNTDVFLDVGTIAHYFGYGSFSGSSSSFNDTLDTFKGYCPNDDISDYGLLVSSEPFITTYMFDITRLPDNATVTISGDSVYDYSITDNSTGDTSTIYNYVNNYYTYPDNSGGNTSGGGVNNGGGIITGGLTVGGHVDVGGKVEIDVNINGGGNGNNYSMPDTSDMDDFLENALDDSSGFRKFLKDFFDFLPPPILALLGTALTCAIIARLLGR